MKKLTTIIVSVIAFSGLYFSSYAKEIPYTEDDRERLIRVEVKLEEGLKGSNQRIEGLEKRIEEGERSLNQRIEGLEKRIEGVERSLNQRIDGLQNLLYIVIGAIIAQIIGVVGFVLWDRRTALEPAIKKNKELEERQNRVEKIVKEIAIRNPEVAEICKNLGLL